MTTAHLQAVMTAAANLIQAQQQDISDCQAFLAIANPNQAQSLAFLQLVAVQQIRTAHALDNLVRFVITGDTQVE